MTINEKTKKLFGYDRPFSIAMWDFSWLERRWTGAGFEDWDTALSELVARGYDTVRIDPYPHLIHADPEKEWVMTPIWTEHAWGSPRLTKITVTENLESPLALGADVVLKQYVNRETDKYNAQGTTSSTALCMIFHALQTALIEETDYQNEQFALIHPGGAVGERLNQKQN